VLTVRGAGGLPVVSITPGSGGHTYYHHDVLGSTTAATVPGMNGAAEVYTYSEFGATSSGSLAYRFGGYRYDSETGLYYVHARYYSPTLGRFLQTDPAGLSGGTNLYAYVGNDPINLTDPSGLAADIGAQATPPPAGYWSNLLGTTSQVIVAPPPGYEACQDALSVASQDMSAITRATAPDNWSVIQSAATANGIDPDLLAAIAVRETGFQDINENDGAGVGVGVFQITVSSTSGVTAAQANNLPWAANYAANMLSTNMDFLQDAHPNFTPDQLLQATAATYNMGLGKNPIGSNISGNPATIDVGTSPKPNGNYGSNVVNLMGCFR